MTFKIRSLAVCAACSLLSLSIEAQSVWNGASNDGLWSDAGNWASGGIPNSSAATADFSQLDITTNTTVTVSSDTVGNLIFGDANTSTAAGWILKSSTLTLNNGGPTPTITVDALGGTNNVTINSSLTGNSGLIKEGPGILVLNAANAFSNSLTVQQGTVALNAIGSYGWISNLITLGSSAGGDAVLLVSSIDLTNEIQLGTSAAGNLTLGNYGTGSQAIKGGVNLNGNNLTVLYTNSSSIYYFESAPITGTGNVTFEDNTASGEIFVETSAGINNVGTITVEGTSVNATGVEISTIGANVTGLNYYTSVTPVTFLKVAMNPAGMVVNSSSTLSVTSGNLGPFQGAGNLMLNANSSGNLFPTFTGYTGIITNSGTGTGTTIIASSLTSGGAATGIVQNSPKSVLLLSGANSFSGATFVQSGTLLINGTNGSGSAVTVASGGILGGVGTIKGPVTVQAGGTLAPGTNDGFTIGTLTNTGSLTLNGNLFFKLNTSLVQSNDYVTGSAAITNLGTGTLTVSNVGPALVTGEIFYLFSHPLIGGNNLAITGGGTTFINNLAVNGSIQVSGAAPPTPPPATISSMTQSGGNLVLVWQGGTNQSCVLLTSTNVALPIPSWTPVATNTVGANGFSTNTLPINPSQPKQFFLLNIP